MKVKNLIDTTDNTCHCGSWKEHYYTYSDVSADRCQVKDCSGEFEVGAHVKKVGNRDNKWYIVPMCKAHNNKDGEEYELKASVTLVSANVAETCG